MIPCAKCGGSGRVKEWVRGKQTGRLKPCDPCKGKGWREEVAFEGEVRLPIRGGGYQIGDPESQGRVSPKPDLMLDDPEA